MALVIGNQKVSTQKDWNYEIEKIQGELDEVQAKLMLGRFLRQNLGLTLYLLTAGAFELLPVQEFIIKAILLKDNALIVGGRGTSKSTIISIMAILYPIFFFNSKMCLISANFRASRRILEFTERIITSKKAKLLKQCFPKDMKRNNDIFKLEIPDPANSEVFALPLSTGEGLRGTRASYVVVDEGLTVTKEIQDSVIRPFLTSRQNMREENEIKKIEDELIAAKMMTELDRTSFPKNKYNVFSSASYQFEHLYEMFNSIIESIMKKPDDREKDPPSYFCMRFSYKALPDNSIIDLTQIKSAAANGGENTDYFKREYEALFTDSSNSYFNIQKMHRCTIKAGNYPTTQVKGDAGSEYLLGIDPSYSASKNSDYFAMGVYLINRDSRSITLVHSYGKAGGETKHHFEYFAYLLTFFNIVFITIDASGTEFLTGFNESFVAKEKNLKVGFLDCDFDTDDANEYNIQLNEAKKQYNLLGRRICYAQKFSSQSLRMLNEYLVNQIEKESVWFASPCCLNTNSFSKQVEITLPFIFQDNREQILSMNDFLELQDRLVTETKAETALIEVRASASGGTLQYDLPSSLRNSQSDNKIRKDLYSVLLISNFAARLLFDMLFQPDVTKQDFFIPRFVT